MKTKPSWEPATQERINSRPKLLKFLSSQNKSGWTKKENLQVVCKPDGIEPLKLS